MHALSIQEVVRRAYLWAGTSFFRALCSWAIWSLSPTRVYWILYMKSVRKHVLPPLSWNTGNSHRCLSEYTGVVGTEHTHFSQFTWNKNLQR